VILLSSHAGSNCYMNQLFQDSMAICQVNGNKPDLFITITANPKWPEITENLLEEQTASDRPDLVARVFEEKNALLNDVKKGKIFGDINEIVLRVQLSQIPKS
ncbi:hypothetical protein P691DRAFT_690815, partial [Macrolepiota fuliginosa MF-IS2]